VYHQLIGFGLIGRRRNWRLDNTLGGGISGLHRAME
jgi:hypothetical protein